MIAAIAQAHDLPVFSCNPGDFEGIDGLTVIPVPVPAASDAAPTGPATR